MNKERNSGASAGVRERPHMNEGITATLTYRCGGCLEEATTEAIPVGSTADWQDAGFAIRGSAMSRVETTTHRLDHIEEAPEGWMPSDPYTRCTYCPDCWSRILDPDDDCEGPNEPRDIEKELEE